VKIYSSQKAHSFPSRYRYVDTVTGEQGEEMLPPGGAVDEYEYLKTLARFIVVPKSASPGASTPAGKPSTSKPDAPPS